MTEARVLLLVLAVAIVATFVGFPRQGARIDLLEAQVRNGTQALQETQIQLADIAASLIAFDNELRKKISASEVDPAIVQLNRNLARARERMLQTADATDEAWDKTQQEADEAFKKLQQSAADVTGYLRKELNLDTPARPAAEDAE